jgi:hypothetical protein
MGDGEATESYQLSRGARGDQTDHVASCQAREQGNHVNKATVASAGERYWGVRQQQRQWQQQQYQQERELITQRIMPVGIAVLHGVETTIPADLVATGISQSVNVAG